MNIWSKMMTAIRGSINEAGEMLVDTQALRILDQEVREAGEALKQAKDSLAEKKAHLKLAQLQIEDVQKQIKQHEGYALQAIEKSDENLAMAVAQRIATLAERQAELEAKEKEHQENCEQLHLVIQQNEQSLSILKQQIDTVKATENVHKAQSAVSLRHAGDNQNAKLRTAMDSLARIKEKQALREAQIEIANEQITDDIMHLDAKLKEAGIISNDNANVKASANEILARIKSEKQQKN